LFVSNYIINVFIKCAISTQTISVNTLYCIGVKVRVNKEFTTAIVLEHTYVYINIYIFLITD